MSAQLHEMPVTDDEIRALAKVELLPVYKALAEAAGLEFFELRNFMMSSEWAEPAGEGLRQGVYVVTRDVAVTTYSGEPGQYATMPRGEYFIAGGVRRTSCYLVTKRGDDGRILGMSWSTYPRMGYLIFVCEIDDKGVLTVRGPHAVSERPEGWP